MPVSKVLTQGTTGSAPGRRRTRPCGRHGSFGHRGSTWTKRVPCEGLVKLATGIVVASSRTCSREAESRAAPKKGPSCGRKMGPKKVKADCRPSQFGGRILVRIEGVIFGPPSLEKPHRETARPPSGTLLAAHATARGQTSHARSATQRTQGSQ